MTPSEDHGASSPQNADCSDAIAHAHEMPNSTLVLVNQITGHLFIDLANEATTRYDRVVLITGEVSSLQTELDSKVIIERIPKYRRSTLASRASSWLAGFVCAAGRIGLSYRRADLLVSTNPPLNVWLAFMAKGSAHLYLLDVYPEALSLTGLMSRKNLIFRIWRTLNELAYRRFSSIHVLTEGMRDVLADYGIHGSVMTRFWPSFEPHEDDGSHGLEFYENVGIPAKFIVLYSGNLGQEHQIDALLDAARRLRDDPQVGFVFAGGGSGFPSLRAAVARDKLTSVSVLPYQPMASFTALLAGAHLGVVAQSSRTASVNMPSKTANLLASATPLIALVDGESEIGRLVAKHDCGIVAGQKDGDKIAQFICALKSDPLMYSRLRDGAIAAAREFDRANARLLVEEVAGATT